LSELEVFEGEEAKSDGEYRLLERGGSLDLGCFSTMTMILSGSLSWNPFILAILYCREYFYL